MDLWPLELVTPISDRRSRRVVPGNLNRTTGQRRKNVDKLLANGWRVGRRSSVNRVESNAILQMTCDGIVAEFTIGKPYLECFFIEADEAVPHRQVDG